MSNSGHAMRRTLTVAAMVALLLTACSPEPEVVTETVEVEVEAVPQACLDALDEADASLSASAEYTEWLTEAEGSAALAAFDEDGDLADWINNMEEQNEWLEELSARINVDDYVDLRNECRQAAN